MKTYTLTWRRLNAYGVTGDSLGRVRFDSLTSLWNPDLPNDKVLQFTHLISQTAFCLSGFRKPCCRLIKCGKLIARQATYQGV